MKLLLMLIGWVLTANVCLADIAGIRAAYPRAAASAASAKELYQKLEDVKESGDKTMVAYKGAALTLLAKYEKKPADKISKMKAGAKLVEMAVAAEPTNTEIRLVRLSIQENVPKIVKYKANMQEDKAYLLAHYKEQQRALREYVISFIKQSKSFTAEEKEQVK